MNDITKISNLSHLRGALLAISLLGAILSLTASKIIIDANSTTPIARASVPILWVLSLCFLVVAGYTLYSEIKKLRF